MVCQKPGVLPLGLFGSLPTTHMEINANKIRSCSLCTPPPPHTHTIILPGLFSRVAQNISLTYISIKWHIFLFFFKPIMVFVLFRHVLTDDQIRKQSCKSNVLYPRKFKGGICCGDHLAVTYGGELLYADFFRS